MEKYQFSGMPEDFRQAIIDMKRAGLLDETGAGLDSPRKKRVIDRRGTSIYYEALGRDGTTLLSVAGDDAQTWELIRDYLLERHWKIQHIPNRVQDSRMHPYLDPSDKRVNKKHRRFVELLIDQALGRNALTNDEIMKQMGWGTSNFYKYRREYMATEAKEEADSI